MVVFDRVVKQFGDHVVLVHLDFAVGGGERVARIGPSGSGKPPILRLLMTLAPVNGGVIWVDGRPLTHQYKGDKLVKASQKHLRAVRSTVGMVFQQDRKSTRLNSSHVSISYAVFCLKKKNINRRRQLITNHQRAGAVGRPNP